MDFEMNYEEMENTQENMEKMNEIAEFDETKDFPPKIVTKGETVEHRAARSELERDIAAGREIAAENSLRRLAKIEAEEAAKKN